MPEATKVIKIVPYNDQWKLEFERIKAMLNSFIGDLILTIEHVGSTSVKGLAAKPIIDVDVVMESYDVFPIIIERLEKEGFTYEGNLGIEGREAFKRRFDDNYMKYHLYVCPKNGKGLLEHIAFRDYLRMHPKDVEAYAALKIDLSKKYRYDIDKYCEHKTDFINGILSKTIYKDDKY